MRQLIPLGDNVLLEKLEIEQKKGSIIIAGMADENSLKVGKVVDMGPGQMDLSGLVMLDPGEKCAVGDICLVSKHGDYEYNLDGKKYLLVRMANIMGRIEEVGDEFEGGDISRGAGYVTEPARGAGECGGGAKAKG